jgi:hypothetical protein
MESSSFPNVNKNSLLSHYFKHRDSDPTPMDEVDFWKRQASHYRTEAETWERIASNLKVRLIRLGEM